MEVRLKGQLYPVLVSVSGVEELEKLELEEDGLLVGASVTLSSLEEALKDVIAELPGKFKTRSDCINPFAGKRFP